MISQRANREIGVPGSPTEDEQPDPKDHLHFPFRNNSLTHALQQDYCGAHQVGPIRLSTKKQKSLMHRSLLLLVFVCLMASAAPAQDPVKVDPKHYTVIFENDQVRVLKIHYGPHEKSVMHSHPDSVVHFLLKLKQQ